MIIFCTATETDIYNNTYTKPILIFTIQSLGRPGGPPFYISTQDNTENHGPGSQGSKSEVRFFRKSYQDSRSEYGISIFTFIYLSIVLSSPLSSSPSLFSPSSILTVLHHLLHHYPHQADSCFGRLVGGVDVLKRMKLQPGAEPPNGTPG